jgi:Ferritin-like domain
LRILEPNKVDWRGCAAICSYKRQKEHYKMGVSRRSFINYAGGLAGAGILLSECKKVTPSNNITMGNGDTGLLNYLYVISQVQLGFYSQANTTPYYGINSSETQLLADLRDHQFAYNGFLKAVLHTDALSQITLQLAQVTFADRTSTLSNATTLQDLAVSAYNGVIQLFSNTGYLPALLKIASVEARHAEYVRDALNYNSFGDGVVIDANGLGQMASPRTVMPLLSTFIQTSLDISGLPTF